MSILNLIKSNHLFHELYDHEIMELIEGCKVHKFKPGEIIFELGDIGEEVYILLNGDAEIVKNDIVIHRLRKGDLFGELVLLKENKRNATIRSSNFSDALVIHYNDIFSNYNRDSRIFAVLMHNLARMLAGRLRSAGSEIQGLKVRINELESHVQDSDKDAA